MLLLRDGLAEKFPLVGYNLQFAFVYSKYYSVKVYYTLSSILDNEFKFIIYYNFRFYNYQQQNMNNSYIYSWANN